MDIIKASPETSYIKVKGIGIGNLHYANYSAFLASASVNLHQKIKTLKMGIEEAALKFNLRKQK